MKKTNIALAILSSIAISSAALARPIELSTPKTRTVELDRYDRPHTIVRERTFGRRAAAFSVAPQNLESPTLFEISSISEDGATKRWSCLALSRTTECFTSKVRIPYLPEDDRVVLHVTAKPDSAPEVLAELKRRAGLVAQK